MTRLVLFSLGLYTGRLCFFSKARLTASAHCLAGDLKRVESRSSAPARVHAPITASASGNDARPRPWRLQEAAPLGVFVMGLSLIHI
eukprot:578445-Prymnesium_polylepis.1